MRSTEDLGTFYGGQCDFSIPHQDEMLFGTEVGVLAPGHIHGRTDITCVAVTTPGLS